MQQTVAVRFLAGTLTLALGVCAFFAAPAAAQPEPALDAVIAAGNPPLTERFVEQYANLQASILEVPVTKEFLAYQRADLKASWNNAQVVNAVVGLVGTVPQMTPENRAFYRVAAQHTTLAYLQTKIGEPAAQFYLASFAAAHQPIAPGNELLTESMVSHCVEFLGWLLEIPVTPAFAADQRARIVRNWKDPSEVASVKRLLQAQLSYAQGSPLQRAYARTIDQPPQIALMRAHAEDPDNRAIVEAFDASHRPLATGRPALTRQMSDAWTELYCFIRDQGLGEHLVADQAHKDAFAAQLARQWPTFNAEQRKGLSAMPNRWAAVQLLWSISQNADRAKIVAAWLPAVNPPDTQTAAAIAARARADAFMKRPPSTVTSREMLQAAADQDLLAAQYRRQGAPALAKDAEDIARVLHTGNPQAYAIEAATNAASRANNDTLAVAQAAERARIAAASAQYIFSRSVYHLNTSSVMSNILTGKSASPFAP